MENQERSNEFEHVINIRRAEATSSTSVNGRTSNEVHPTQHEDRPSSSSRSSVSQPPLPLSNLSNSFSTRGNGLGLGLGHGHGHGHGQRRRNSLNSGYWITVELLLTLAQISASVIVLCLSRNELPRTPLFAWIVGYAVECFATLPLLCFRYVHHYQSSEQDPSQPRQSSSNANTDVGHSDPSQPRQSSSNANTDVGHSDDGPLTVSLSRFATSFSAAMQNSRFKAFVEYFKKGLDCFFAVWFVVGIVWICGGHVSYHDAPNLYRFCIVFLIFSCIGYAMPFILWASICCCLPCILSVVGYSEDFNLTRVGATSESINSLPTYKFKLKKTRIRDRDVDAGVVAAGTEKERVISGEDAVCCICLAKYANNEELRELPCSHLFHKQCVDKWLKINALCPLCKSEVGNTLRSSVAGIAASLRRAETRVSNNISSGTGS